MYLYLRSTYFCTYYLHAVGRCASSQMSNRQQHVIMTAFRNGIYFMRMLSTIVTDVQLLLFIFLRHRRQ